MTSIQSDTAERPYHHGDLRQAILDAALDVLSETQSTEFSLRELARRAGVSHNAPYKHFADKQDLLAAVSARGFDRLTVKMTQSGEQAVDPSEKLKTLISTYVSEGVHNPALYRLMFGGQLTAQLHDRPDIEIAAASKLRSLLIASISDGALASRTVGSITDRVDLDGALLVLWSTMHGLAMLLIDGLIGPREHAEQLAETTLDAVVDGLSNKGLFLPAGTWVGPAGSR